MMNIVMGKRGNRRKLISRRKRGARRGLLGIEIPHGVVQVRLWCTSVDAIFNPKAWAKGYGLSNVVSLTLVATTWCVIPFTHETWQAGWGEQTKLLYQDNFTIVPLVVLKLLFLQSVW